MDEKEYRLDFHVKKSLRFDAAESIFVENQLKEIDTRIFETKFPEIRFRDFLPIKNISNAMQTYSYKMYTMYGLAKWISDYASDLPRAGVKAQEYFRQIKGFGIAFGWSMQEMRAAAATNTPLEDMEAQAARRACEEFFDAVARTGDSGLGLLGLLNQTNTTLYTVPNGISGSAEFKDKTPDEVVADLNGIVNNIVTSTKEVEKPDTLLLPTEQFTDISSRRMGDGDSTTILNHFKQSNPYIKNVGSWYQLTGAGTGGSDRMIAYRRDPMNLEMVIAQEAETFPPQMKNLALEIAMHARTAGVVVRYPLSISYGDGI